MLRRLMSVVAGAAVLSSLTAVFSTPSYAADVRFFCGEQNGKLFTFAQRPGRDPVRVVNWNSREFSRSGYNPLTRCNQVSERFQKEYNRNGLAYITVGIVNGYRVVCNAEPLGSCNSDNILFTVNSKNDAVVSVQQIFVIRDGNASSRIYVQESSGRTYLDLGKVINSDAAQPSDSPEATPAAEPSAKPNSGRF
ncbi:MAG: COP23 domain-containing protein [Gloeotrichia echinulata CP02]|jgi:hypothetical protein